MLLCTRHHASLCALAHTNAAKMQLTAHVVVLDAAGAQALDHTPPSPPEAIHLSLTQPQVGLLHLVHLNISCGDVSAAPVCMAQQQHTSRVACRKQSAEDKTSTCRHVIPVGWLGLSLVLCV